MKMYIPVEIHYDDEVVPVEDIYKFFRTLEDEMTALWGSSWISILWIDTEKETFRVNK